MNIKIDKIRMTATVTQNNKVVKTQEINKDEFKNLMTELSGDRISMLRTANKLFKVKSYTFKDVKV